jgi:hypothetical protein
MRLRGVIPIVLVCIGFGITGASAVEEAGPRPLQLKKFMKGPVSSSATRTVKKADGEYAQLPAQRLRKKATKQPTTEEITMETANALEAANAFASVMESQVKVVSANEVNEIDLAADADPIIPIAVPTSAETVHVVGPNEINALDRAADKETVAMVPTAEPAVESSSTSMMAELKSWGQRMIEGINIVFAAATTAVKALFA